jgi:hypothetical protein
LKEARKKPTLYLKDVIIGSNAFDVDIYGSTRGAAEIIFHEKTDDEQTNELEISGPRTALLVLTRDKIKRLSLPEAPTAVEAEIVDSFFEDVRQGLTEEEVKASWVNWFLQWSYRIEFPSLQLQHLDPNDGNLDPFSSSFSPSSSSYNTQPQPQSQLHQTQLQPQPQPQRGPTLPVRVKPLEVPTSLKDFKWNLSDSNPTTTTDSHSHSRLLKEENASLGYSYFPRPSKKQVAVFFRDTDTTNNSSRRNNHHK